MSSNDRAPNNIGIWKVVSKIPKADRGKYVVGSGKHRAARAPPSLYAPETSYCAVVDIATRRMCNIFHGRAHCTYRVQPRILHARVLELIFAACAVSENFLIRFEPVNSA